MYVQERSQTGATRRLSATEVFNFLSQNNIQTQLSTHLAVEKVFPKTGMTAEQLKQYLDNPPAGETQTVGFLIRLQSGEEAHKFLAERKRVSVRALKATPEL